MNQVAGGTRQLDAGLIERLMARLHALEVMKSSLGKEGVDVYTSIRRVSRSLQLLDGIDQCPEVLRAIQSVGECAREQVAVALDRLIGALREATMHVEDEKLGVLVIEADADAIMLLETHLAATNRELVFAQNATEAAEMLERHKINLILMDLSLPETEGRQLVLQLMELTSGSVPIFAIAGSRSGSLKRTECYALGVSRYFVKPIDLDELANAVAAELRANRKTGSESRVDALTGLPSRESFCAAFKRSVSLAGREKSPLSIALLEIDGLKSTYDIHGRSVGDNLIRGAAKAIQQSARASDMIARWGWGEFAVLFPSTSSEGMLAGLQKLLDSAKRQTHVVADNQQLPLSISAGVVEVPEHATVEESIDLADRLLQQARSKGPGLVMSSDSQVMPDVKRRILLADDDDLVTSIISHRLEREGYEIVPVRDGSEALNAANEFTFSLFILNVQIPKVDGFELLQRLRGMPIYARVPIVLLTALGQEKDIVRGFDLGTDDYIVKPFSPVELVARIRRLLNKR